MAEGSEVENEQWDHSSNDQFIKDYVKKSTSEEAWQRFCSIRDSILRVIQDRESTEPLDVLDVGCNTGTLCMTWSALGHRANGLDVSKALLEIAENRAADKGYEISYRLGSATGLPWPDESMDVCTALELLEHVDDWQACLAEFTRVLKPGGVLLVTTTSALYPFQDEFNLPLYAWYPAPLKRYFVRLAQTTKPSLANFAKYPAVHWFTFGGLRTALRPLGCHCLSRFHAMDLANKSPLARLLVQGTRKSRMLHFLATSMTKGTIVYAIKKRQVGEAQRRVSR